MGNGDYLAVVGGFLHDGLVVNAAGYKGLEIVGHGGKLSACSKGIHIAGVNCNHIGAGSRR